MAEVISILGSTGSIGTQALDVIRHLGNIKVAALAAGSNIGLLERQIIEFSPKIAAVADKSAAEALKARLAGYPVKIYSGEGSLLAAVETEADMVLAATSGTSGLESVYAAIQAGKDIALANKESLVCAGSMIMDSAKRMKAGILPVDSEHSAIFQCIAASPNAVKKIILTASGGPFLNTPANELENVTVQSALSHPNWKMGKKITIDSATMMNKGFEWIEAKWLFGISEDDIQIAVHPESIVHSAVEFIDGAVIAQMGLPDMRVPIQYALTYPNRQASLSGSLDFSRAMSLSFQPPDASRFACLGLAYRAMKEKPSVATAMAAADDAAVESFLGGKIRFMQIARVIEETMAFTEPFEPAGIKGYVEWAKEAYKIASSIAEKLSKSGQ